MGALVDHYLHKNMFTSREVSHVTQNLPQVAAGITGIYVNLANKRHTASRCLSIREITGAQYLGEFDDFPHTYYLPWQMVYIL